jgi:hypothetical protein
VEPLSNNCECSKIDPIKENIFPQKIIYKNNFKLEEKKVFLMEGGSQNCSEKATKKGYFSAATQLW